MQKICGTGKLCFFKKQDPDPGSGFKILICRIRIRPKMDRIRNPDRTYNVPACMRRFTAERRLPPAAAASSSRVGAAARASSPVTAPSLLLLHTLPPRPA